MSKRRNLSRSDVRAEAANLLCEAVESLVSAGAVSERGGRRGWTDDDVLAVEVNLLSRIDAINRRAPRLPPDGATEGDETP